MAPGGGGVDWGTLTDRAVNHDGSSLEDETLTAVRVTTSTTQVEWSLTCNQSTNQLTNQPINQSEANGKGYHVD